MAVIDATIRRNNITTIGHSIATFIVVMEVNSFIAITAAGSIDVIATVNSIIIVAIVVKAVAITVSITTTEFMELTIASYNPTRTV